MNKEFKEMDKELTECFSTVKYLLDKIPSMFQDLLKIYEMDGEWEYEGIEEFGAGTVTLKLYRRTCGCCDGDYDSLIIPINYLWDLNWKDDLRAKVRAAKEEQLRKQNEEAERIRKAKLKSAKEAKIKKEERERAEYERLKKKFEMLHKGNVKNVNS